MEHRRSASIVSILGVFLSMATVGALREPNCTVQSSTTCVGYPIDNFAKGSTIQDILADLYSRFCGCTHVTGNIRIDLATGENNITLTENDFNMFYHLREVSGVFTILNSPPISNLTLPNLRIIRGDELITTIDGHTLALSITNSEIYGLYLPELREITLGDVLFEDIRGLCNYKGVIWEDILNSGELLDRNTGCNMTTDVPDCSNCDSGGGMHSCWSPEYCHILSKVVCLSCELDRCYRVTGDIVQCCNPLCAASCYGSSSRECWACKDFANNGTCVTQCPPEIIYNSDTFQLEPNPEYKLAAGDLCVEQCPEVLFELSGSCVRKCPDNFTSSAGKCFACDGPCPTECDGLTTDEVVDATTIERFRGCNIVTTGGVYISTVHGDPGWDNSMLETLSTIEEIRGPLRIESWDGESFPYLCNLRRLGTEGSGLTFSCGEQREYSLVFGSNADLKEIDLGSLELIRGAGIAIFNNLQLCYTGNFSLYVEDPSYHQCIFTMSYPWRRNSTECVSEGYECHPQCNSRYSCWGPNDTLCDRCLNYYYNGGCIQNCSDVDLPEDSSGLYQNSETRMCEDCDYECLGCIGGTGPTHCIACRNYFIQLPTGQLCVGTCPPGTYLEVAKSECIPCNESCPSECAGPLPYIDVHHGCLECDRVILDATGNQVRCIQTGCPVGTYATVSEPTREDMPPGTDVCPPCHELCGICTGPSVELDLECYVCKYATDRSEGCVKKCKDTEEYLDNVTGFCNPCANGCHGCTGPSTTNCLTCSDGYVQCGSEEGCKANCTDSGKDDVTWPIVFVIITVLLLAVIVCLVLALLWRVFKNTKAQSTIHPGSSEDVKLNDATLVSDL